MKHLQCPLREVQENDVMDLARLGGSSRIKNGALARRQEDQSSPMASKFTTKVARAYSQC